MDAKTLGAQPANPMPGEVSLPASGTYAASPIDGLTKREAFAMAAMQGLLANPGGPVQRSDTTGWGLCNCTPEEAAGFAADMADALLLVLSNTQRDQQ